MFIVSALVVGGSFTSCARMEAREPRYNASACPFCSLKPGVCSYCEGTKKCTFCNGTGKRHTVSPAVPEENVKGGEYTEACPYCKGTGVCRYCDGKGFCWACGGSGKSGDWDFYSRYLKLTGTARDSLVVALKDSVAAAKPVAVAGKTAGVAAKAPATVAKKK
jgi:RecJ-like exonuclease